VGLARIFLSLNCSRAEAQEQQKGQAERKPGARGRHKIASITTSMDSTWKVSLLSND
jgi:hypothetical protein